MNREEQFSQRWPEVMSCPHTLNVNPPIFRHANPISMRLWVGTSWKGVSPKR